MSGTGNLVGGVYRSILVGAVLAAGCRAPEGPTKNEVLFGLSDAAIAGEDDVSVGRHRWAGWHVLSANEPAPRKVCKALVEACALERAGLREEAIDTLSKALENYPKCSLLLEARGALYAGLGYQRAAAGDFQRAVWLSPSQPGAWSALGRVQNELKLDHQALRALDRAGELGLDTFDYHLSLARTYRGLERRGKAAEHYLTAIEKRGEPSVELYVEAATLATEGGDDVLSAEALDQALHLVDRALDKNPSSSQAWFVRALLYEAADEPAETVAAYLRALEVDPEHVAAWTNLALFSLRLGDPETSEDAARRALELETDPRRRRALQRLLARH